ncbi:N-acetyltransferase [Salipaludibacillus neizhouensis]|uniref:N-acetyltransferase n=1 Tax=Salipaludibacillus neizhouensis TaxID=885475 RepID=A0A3A9KA63_9BACI|nr:GNAT family N-acetyltransferase [Salipaludibacillus neizhouensis]RKL67650.1 N-acetyltransferase [Salipaludibacillus neizhouensis]
MLVSYKKEHEKIAMGLLSFMPGEKSIKKIQKVIDKYTKSETLKLYLWRTEANQFVGVIGVEEDNEDVYLRDLTVDPSHRNEGLALTMVQAMEDKYSVYLIGLKHTDHFLKHCRKKV